MSLHTAFTPFYDPPELSLVNVDLADLEKRIHYSEAEQAAILSEVQRLTDRRATLLKESELLTMASAALRELVAAVADKNLRQVEKLVNSALAAIFTDQNLDFKIVTTELRNQTSYRIALYSNGIEGNLNSFGGGVWAVVAFVLKLTFNLLAKRYPLVVFDESLSFLSAKYIPNASKFITDMCTELGMTIVLVTHQSEFATFADMVYEAQPGPANTVVFHAQTK